MKIVNTIWDGVKIIGRMPSIAYREQLLLRLRIVDAAINPVAQPEADSWTATIGSSPFYAKSLLINQPGDWLDGGTADLTLGQFSIRLDAANANFKSKMGELSSKKEKLEVQGSLADGKLAISHQIPMIVINLLDDNGPVPDPLDEGYDVRWYTEDDGTKILAHRFPDGVWCVLRPTIQNGVRTHAWEEVTI